MSQISEIFASYVFNDQVMQERLPKDIYTSLHKTIEEGAELDLTVANVVAGAMKDWAMEKGATHYTHWFQPMTGITAEKHDSFISPQPDGRVIMEFSGKELIRGEPDASSFPSGGLRATFEARGYTAWDPTSYAFVKDNSLCIPTVFCSYVGDVLDKKTPLLRSMELINREGLRILRLFGDTATTHITATVGPEQEYFLIDKELFKKRKDLFYTGRTLYGAKPPKGQELDDHYFGAIRPRVMAFMKDLNNELWKLGVYAKTEHNEAAPAQHELAPVFTTANTAIDHNQLTMEIMNRVADRHGLSCLLHEKPFAGINGSGKHNNWSLSTNSGKNLLKPGKQPHENKQFLLFLCAVIEAVDSHQDLLRISASSAGNDHRLGANEAPPAIVSIYLGDELGAIIDCLERGVPYEPVKRATMNTGVSILPDFKKDSTDRNRTSPFAFTGNKFEFRMLGSSFSASDPNTVINTIVADVLSKYADELEKAVDFDESLGALMQNALKKHGRIIFNGNNYAPEWVAEAERRGLENFRSAADAIPHFTDKKNIDLFTRHKVFSENELRSRVEILLENYCKVLNIESLTMLDIARRDILPASLAYSGRLAEAASVKAGVGIDISCDVGVALSGQITELCTVLNERADALDAALQKAACVETLQARAEYMRDHVLADMSSLRAAADMLEPIVDSRCWPFPTYGELLFSV